MIIRWKKEKYYKMEKASKVMYTIANIFNWIMVVLCIVGIVFSSLAIAGTLGGEHKVDFVGIGSLIYCIIVLIFCLITIWLVRMAKKNNTSKGWDLLFIILGILDLNIFYFLGGLFGVIAPRR